MTQLQLSVTERQAPADDLTVPSEVVAIFPTKSRRAIAYRWEPPSRWHFATSNRSAAASVVSLPWCTVFAPLAVTSAREPSPPAAISPGGFTVITEPDARRLRAAIPQSDISTVLQAIRDARAGIGISSVKLRRSIEPEDPNWEELVFEVRVEAGPSEALAYWDRIGETLDEAMAKLDQASRERFAMQVAVHVTWE